MTALVSQERADQIFREYQSWLPTLLDERPQGVVVLSASQVERFVLCKRWWAIEYIFGVRSPQKASAQLGDFVHKLLENWLKDATPITGNSRAAVIARRMVKYLPQPGSGVPERKFYFRTRHGHYYTGRMDWSGVLYDALHQLIVVGIDHKTTGNYADYYKRDRRGNLVFDESGEPVIIQGYGKTEADLHVDIQATIYAIALFVGFESSLVELFWNYGETKKENENPQVVPVKTRVHLPIVFAKFDQVIEPIAAEIILLHQQKPHPFQLPPTVTACDAYGGCPHQEYCNISDAERLNASMTLPDNNMAARMAGTFPPGYNGAPPQQGFQQPPPGGYQQAPQPQYQQAPQPQYQQPQGGPQPFVPGQGAPQQAQQPQQPQYQQPQQGFPQQPQGGFGAPPGGFAPPGAAPQQQLPPQGNYQQQPSGPNAPETGGQLPQAVEGEEGGKGRRGRGRPAGAKNKELGIEDSIYLAGVAAMIANPAWDGSSQRLAAAGAAALDVMKARLG
jgi:hypothetical protein